MQSRRRSAHRRGCGPPALGVDAGGLDRRVVGTGGDGQQGVHDTVLGLYEFLALFRGQVIVDFLFADLYALVDVTLTAPAA
jgi:hypothetical protein